MRDRQVPKDTPLPCTLEFYCHVGSNQEKLHKFTVNFTMPPRPSVSVCLLKTRKVLINLMEKAGMDVHHLYAENNEVRNYHSLPFSSLVNKKKRIRTYFTHCFFLF